MKDPRAENFRRFAEENGKVVRVNLTHLSASGVKVEPVFAGLVEA